MTEARMRWSVHTVAFLVGICATSRLAASDDKKVSIPVCEKIYGTLSIDEPQQNWWGQYNLESPEHLIKVFVSESKCFTLLDRGRGLAAGQRERDLAANGDLRVGSNLGKGQIKAADYVLVPDMVSKNANARTTNIGGALGGLLHAHGAAGVALGGVNLKTKTADVVLTLTDVRSSEQVALAPGHAKKTDLGWGGAGAAYFGVFAAGGASSYANTETGQIVAMAYLDAYRKLVDTVKQRAPDAKAENVAQAVKMAKPGRMYAQPDLKSAIVQELEPGRILYPSGEKSGDWWKVSDELGHEGWVSSFMFDLAR